MTIADGVSMPREKATGLPRSSARAILLVLPPRERPVETPFFPAESAPAVATALAVAFAYRFKRKLGGLAPAALPAAGADGIPIVCGPSGLARGVSDAASHIVKIMHDSRPIYGKDSFRMQVAAGNNVAITSPVRGYNVAGIGIPAGSARLVCCPVTLVGIPS